MAKETASNSSFLIDHLTLILQANFMKISDLHIGLSVKHPQYGIGEVKTISETNADILFNEGRRTVTPETCNLEHSDPQVSATGLEMPLGKFVEQVVNATVAELGLAKTDELTQELGARWGGGKLMTHPADISLQAKEVPLETFFHKIVMMRNNLRVLEQKINGHDKLSDAEKVEMQQYITRCYGSMTTFNILLKTKEGQFGVEK